MAQDKVNQKEHFRLKNEREARKAGVGGGGGSGGTDEEAVKRIMNEGLANLKVEQAASNQQANEADVAERKTILEEAKAKAEAAITVHREMIAANDAAHKKQQAETETKFDKRFQQVGDIKHCLSL